MQFLRSNSSKESVLKLRIYGFICRLVLNMLNFCSLIKTGSTVSHAELIRKSSHLGELLATH